MDIITNDGFDLPQNVVEYLVSLGKDPGKYRIGKVCVNNHDFNDLGFAIRLKRDRGCIVCNSEHQKRLYNRKKALLKQRYEENKLTILEKRKDYRQKNKVLISERRKVYHAKTKQQRKQYRMKNRELFLNHSRNRRALKLSVTVDVISINETNELLKKFYNKCAYCGISLKKHLNIEKHLDHVIPLSKGGKHSITNLIPTCSRCNLSKNCDFLDHWYPKQSFYSVLRHRKILVHIRDIKALNSLVNG
jgi:5-methylcytosine-specific restriction endonuclease McrA